MPPSFLSVFATSSSKSLNIKAKFFYFRFTIPLERILNTRTLSFPKTGSI